MVPQELKSQNDGGPSANIVEGLQGLCLESNSVGKETPAEDFSIKSASKSANKENVPPKTVEPQSMQPAQV